jgi:class 3 adenylate cyclase/AmiR/NasT family two-component response regulator
MTRDGTASPEASGNILVAEDDAAFRGAICGILRSRGFTVTEASSGEEALALVSQNLPDLIILDLHFSGIDGFNVCRILRDTYAAKFLPIIVLSGDGAVPEHRVRGLEAGAYDFLAKPVRTKELLAKVDSFLKMKRLHETVENQREKLLTISHVQESLIHDQQEQMKLLRRFFSPQVADAVVRSRDLGVVNHHKRELTVCFIDLRGFTAFAESTDPDAVIDVLNEYYRVVCGLALAHNGTISSLAGDGIMAFFNDPVPVPNHTECALNFLLGVRTELEKCLGAWREKGYSLGFGAGLASGSCIVGAVGFEQFVHYTAISTTVNLAARLCQRAQVGQMLATLRGLRDVEGRVKLEPAGVCRLKGISVEVSVMNVLGWLE